MAQPTVELAAELKITDGASAALNKIRTGVQSVSKHFDSAAASALSFAKHTASTALGVQMAGIGGTMKALADRTMNAALGVDKQQLALTSAMLMQDKAGEGYLKLREKADKLHGELEQLGIVEGVSAGAVVDAYADISARSQKSGAEMRSLMADIVSASRIIPGGIQEVTSGMQMMEMGMIRARNPIVQMIVQTGLLKGNAREVAMSLTKLNEVDPGKAVKLGEQAIAIMGQKMKKIPLDYRMSWQSMMDMQSNLYEIFGTGLLKGITPAVQQLRKEFFKNQMATEDFAARMGKTVGEWAKTSATFIEDAFAWVNKNWDSIATNIKSAASALYEAIKFLVNNKTLIAAAFATHFAMSTGGAVAKSGGALLNGATAVAGGFAKMGAAEAANYKNMGMSAGGAGVAGGLAAFVATTAAVVAWGLAIEQGVKLYDETVGVEMRSRQAVIDRLNEENAAREKLLVDMRKRDQAQQHLLELGYKMAQAQATPDKFAETQQNAMDFASMAKKGYTVGAAGENIGTTYTEGAAMVTEFTAAFKSAQESHNQATVNQALRMLQSSGTLQLALVQSGLNVEGGFEALLEAAEKGGSEFGKMAKGLKALLGNGKLDPSKMGVNIGGGNTFNIKQEFREGDPDRVLTVFKGGIAKAALSRLNARVSTPFGGF